jgi:hypothetical protein
MVRRFALTVVAVLLAGVGSLGLSPQPTENAFTVMGIVEMSTSSDGRETVVSIDRHDAAQPAESSVLPANQGLSDGRSDSRAGLAETCGSGRKP